MLWDATLEDASTSSDPTEFDEEIGPMLYEQIAKNVSIPPVPSISTSNSKEPLVVHLKSWGHKKNLRGKELSADWVDCGIIERAFFNEADRAHHRFKCCGLNGRHMLLVAMSKGFATTMRNIREMSTAKNKPGAKLISMGMQCSGGQHRSVAILAFTSAILKRLGAMVIEDHLTWRPCGCPIACNNAHHHEISSDTLHAEWATDGITAYAIAFRVWEAVGVA